MPHLILEYTRSLDQSLDLPSTLLNLNKAMLASGEFKDDDIKARAVPLDTVVVGTKSLPPSFLHLQVSLMSGRTEQVRQNLARALVAVLRQAVNPPQVTQITVDIAEMDRALYAKEIVTP